MKTFWFIFGIGAIAVLSILGYRKFVPKEEVIKDSLIIRKDSIFLKDTTRYDTIPLMSNTSILVMCKDIPVHFKIALADSSHVEPWVAEFLVREGMFKKEGNTVLLDGCKIGDKDLKPFKAIIRDSTSSVISLTVLDRYEISNNKLIIK